MNTFNKLYYLSTYLFIKFLKLIFMSTINYEENSNQSCLINLA